MIKISELQTKDVVNIVDGKNLGTISDLEIDLKNGRIEAIVCPGAGKFFGMFQAGQDIVISWGHIVKIGSDVILVRLDEKPYLIDDDDRSASESQSPVYRPYSHN